jgi:hypothetical protein
VTIHPDAETGGHEVSAKSIAVMLSQRREDLIMRHNRKALKAKDLAGAVLDRWSAPQRMV